MQELHVQQVELELQNAELRQSHLALALSRDRYSDLYEFAPLGYVTLDQAGRVQEANLAAATMLGVEREKLCGANFANWFDRNSQDEFYLHRRLVFASQIRQSCELTVQRADRTLMAVHAESVAFTTDQEQHCRTALLDVTTVKNAREQLEKSEQRYRRLTNALTDCIYRVRVEDGRGVETVYGANCEAMTGHTPGELQANPAVWQAMLPVGDRASVERQARAVLAGDRAPPVEHRIRRKDGDIRWVRNTVSPNSMASGTSWPTTVCSATSPTGCVPNNIRGSMKKRWPM